MAEIGERWWWEGPDVVCHRYGDCIQVRTKTLRKDGKTPRSIDHWVFHSRPIAWLFECDSCGRHWPERFAREVIKTAAQVNISLANDLQAARLGLEMARAQRDKLPLAIAPAKL